MLRTRTRFGVLAAAAMLPLGVLGPAEAAEGKMIINSTTYRTPVGCYQIDARPVRISNHTASQAVIFTGPGCTGSVDTVAYPGAVTTSASGMSVRI